MSLMTILKVTKTQGFTLSLEDKILENHRNAWSNWLLSHFRAKDTRRENTLSNKTQAFTESINMGIWVIRTLSQLFIRISHTQTKFSKK